jgi:PAS domain S-box-containing protein
MSTTELHNDLEKKIKKLEDELALLKAKLPPKQTVKVPEAIEGIFNQAQDTVKSYFSNLEFHPDKGTIEINDQRYVLIRASALSDEFFNNINELYTEKSSDESFNIASNFLFDFGHLIGKQDAKRFHQDMKLDNPLSKLAAGPVHFAYAGWAFVEILPESKPQANEDFFLKYNHPYSFEADSWIRNKKVSDKPVCVMNSAYSSGWCEESFGIPLTAVEITCRAKGDDNCCFIMAHPSKIEQRVEKEFKIHKLKTKPEIPFFFERKEIEQKLIQNQNLLRTAQQISKLGSWEYDLQTNNLIWSEELYNIFEIDPTETQQNELYEKYIARFHKDDIGDLHNNIEYAIKEGKQYSFTHRIILPNKSIKWIFGSGMPLKDSNGLIVKLLGYAQDITERINTEVELNKFFKLSSDLLCLASFDGNLTKVSYGWKKVLGYSQKELTSKPFISFVHPDDVQKTLFELKSLIDGDFTIGFENRYRCKDGTYKILNWNASPDKKTGQIYCIVRDVTEDRAKEKILNETLKEKEILLKEVHHRVKNNLQIISSLMNLQSSVLVNKDLVEAFNDSQNRIKSIASIHELLYQSSDLGSIYFDDYLKKLCSDLIYSYFGLKGRIKFKIDAPYRFNIDTSIPLGLLLNEIISNSLKHGLKNNENDELNIKISKLNPNQFELLIEDNGKGYDFELSEYKNDSLGIMLIQQLSEQLNGEIVKLPTKKGVKYQLIFSEN